MINNNIFSLYSKGASYANKNKIKKKEGVQFQFFFFEGSEVSIIVISLKSTWQSELNFHMASLRLKLQRWLGMSHSLFLKFPVELYFLVLTK